jgi:1,4-dihydroxy-2-naphthoyl-CoA hydrolase
MRPMTTDPAELPVTGTIHDSLGIRTLEATRERVVVEMEVGPRVHQPFGIMHGGASAVMVESAASIGAYVSVQPGHNALGIDLNVSHLKAVRAGVLRAVAQPVRKGRTIHVWTVEVTDEAGDRIAVGRCTLAIKEARP